MGRSWCGPISRGRLDTRLALLQRERGHAAEATRGTRSGPLGPSLSVSLTRLPGMKTDAQVVREIQMLFRDTDGDGIRRQHATELQAIFAGEGLEIGIRKMRRLAASAAVLMRRKAPREMAAAG